MSRSAELVGIRGASYRFRVEEGKVAEFARAVGAHDPLFTDPAAAAAAGLAGPLAPPTFSAASAFWAPPDGGVFGALGLDLKRVLAGGGEWEYLAPVVAGDELEVSTVVASVEEKTGGRGPMVLIGVRTEFRRGDELVQTYTNTIIQFGGLEPAREDEEERA